MSAQCWIACGQAVYRLELLGQVEAVQEVEDGNTPPAYYLSSIVSIHICNVDDPHLAPDDRMVTQVAIEEIFLDTPLSLRSDTTSPENMYTLKAPPAGTLVLEGLEGADDPFLDLVVLSGKRRPLEHRAPLGGQAMRHTGCRGPSRCQWECRPRCVIR